MKIKKLLLIKFKKFYHYENTPIEQENLYGYSDFFKYIKLLFDIDKLPNKIIFSGKKGIGKSTFTYHLTNYIFSIG